jgi:hypothetical protein
METVFWDVALYSLVKVYRRFRATHASVIRVYQTIFRIIPEDGHIYGTSSVCNFLHPFSVSEVRIFSSALHHRIPLICDVAVGQETK